MVADVVRLVGGVEDLLKFLFEFPLYPLQVFLILLASWRLLGRELGIERLIWNERWWVQFWAGWAIAIVFGVSLFVRYLVDFQSVQFGANEEFWLLKWVAPTDQIDRPHWTLFPTAGGAVRPLPVGSIELRRVGAVLLWGYIAFGGLLVLPKVYGAATVKLPAGPWCQRAASYLRARRWLVPGVVGYLAGIAFVFGLYQLDESTGIREGIQGTGLLQALGFEPGRALFTLHAVALYLFVCSLIAVNVFHAAVGLASRLRPGAAVANPVVLAAFVLVIVDLVYGWLVFGLLDQQLDLAWVVAGGLVVLVIAANSATLFRDNNYRLRFRGLDLEYCEVLTRPPGTDLSPGADRGRPIGGLLRDQDVLRAVHDRWAARYPGTKPKIVLVAASGGGGRSAIWTGLLLEAFARECRAPTVGAGLRLFGEFHEHVRLFAGASGGMVGAGLSVAAIGADKQYTSQPRLLPTDEAGLGPVSAALGLDSLMYTVQTAVVWDMGLNLFLPPGRPAAWDRGNGLERKWELNARLRGLGPQTDARDTAATLAKLTAQGQRPSPFSRTFADLRELEATGERPSLIFSPMMVEDSRRLLISNLDLDYLASVHGPRLGAAGPAVLSRPAVEFFKRFPAAHDRFAVGTAARMSATFPVVTPAVSLPTDPPRRMVDAGYFDNYGLDLIARWMLRNRNLLIEYTAGVAVVEVRAFPLQGRGVEFCPEDPEQGEAGGLISDALAVVSTPLQAVLRARGNAAYHRNNELLATLDESFNRQFREGFLTSAAFELDTDASLNWYLSSVERRNIILQAAAKRAKVAALIQWLGT